MSSFSPSKEFNNRWLASPEAMKQVIHNELDDIILLLKDETQVVDFEFSTPNLGQRLNDLQTAHLETLRQVERQARQAHAEQLQPILENQIDVVLNEKIQLLSDELKAWLRTTIQEELARMNAKD